MERLHKVVSILACLTCWLALPPCTVSGQDVCSLKVRVLSSDGQRVAAPVKVEEKTGRVEEKDQEGRDVQFCDLGVTPVQVTVGSDTLCNQVSVRNVPITWSQPYLLVVTYDPKACTRLEITPQPTPACGMLVRVADSSNGKWVLGATVSVSALARYVTKTDRYGRVYFGVGVQNDARGTVTAAGFRSADFTATCSGSQDPHELVVRLERQ